MSVCWSPCREAPCQLFLQQVVELRGALNPCKDSKDEGKESEINNPDKIVQDKLHWTYWYRNLLATLSSPVQSVHQGLSLCYVSPYQ